MADNKKMRKAKAVKNDEFYTEYGTISDEMGHYRKQFEGQVVYCNCDDPEWSNFWKYFHSNFGSLNLKKLICTHYQKEKGTPSYALVYEGGNDFDMSAGKVVTIEGNDRYNAGDFRSEACIGFLKEATVVATNPPFSLFREYIAQLVEYDKKFVILGNQNASICKEIFPFIKTNRIWYGASIHSGGVDFRMPDDYEKYSPNVFIRNGHHYINLSGIRWFTNMDVKYRHDGLWHKNGEFDNTIAHKYYEGNEANYPRFDNYPDVINVGATRDIPIDYTGVMAVPLTWLDKYNPLEFEILEGSNRYGIYDYWGKNESIRLHRSHGNNINGVATYFRIHVRNLNPISRSNDRGY